MAPAKRKGGVDSSDAIEANSRATSPGTEGSKRTREPNAIWSEDDIQSLLDQLKDAKAAGETSENGFKTKVWTAIQLSYIDPLKRKNWAPAAKWSRIKKDYKTVKAIRDASGFGWDDVNYIAIAEDHVWQAYIKVSIIYCRLS
jgi:Myb/SANT-like DNA-binding domain